jgi:hypothetical protein
MDQDILRKLEERLGPLYARQRLGIEMDQEAQIFGQSLLSFHVGNWYPVHSVIRNTLKLTGLYWRARRNTERILVKRNDVMFKELPPLFDGLPHRAGSSSLGRRPSSERAREPPPGTRGRDS